MPKGRRTTINFIKDFIMFTGPIFQATSQGDKTDKLNIRALYVNVEDYMYILIIHQAFNE